MARKHNPRIRKAENLIKVWGGEQIIARSRFLPQVGLLYNAGFEKRTWAREDYSSYLEIRQRVLEFGKTSPAETERLRQEWNALFEYEDAASAVFSEVRRSYFSLRLVQMQLVQHDSLLQIYDAKVERAQERLRLGAGLRTAVVTAKLDQLEALERINTLRFDELTRRAALKKAMGMESDTSFFFLSDRLPPLAISMDSVVARALESNTRIAWSEAEAYLAQKSLREVGWEFTPDLQLSGGIRRGDQALEARVSTDRPDSRHQWAADIVGTRRLQEPQGGLSDSNFLTRPFFSSEDENLEYTARLQMRFPLFEGLKTVGSYRRESARYAAARDEVLRQSQETELAALRAMQAYQLSLRQLEVQEQRLALERERFALNQTLYEMGKLSEEGLEQFRERQFRAQDSYFAQQFRVLETEEDLRFLIRLFQ